ncbi:MAG: FAD-dependent oxidoreductase [Pedobacter sp.]|jgi:2-polyprenyl-6-methoxyphenol hydroxylase-like FAD-dependent oxidoreductase|nr:FAD-dependent oxidoreductase [Pedobacter sp.]
MDAAVIIIGAGPTGLMAACQLGRYGISAVVVDSKAGPTVQSRALLVTARSLEIYDQMGVAETVVSDGTHVEEASIFTQGTEKLNFQIGAVGQGLTDFPYMHVYEQSKNEQLLYDVLSGQGNLVMWDTEFTGLEQDKDGVSVHLIKHLPKEHTLTLRAKYVIGCDGASSKIRQILNCKFEGGTYNHKFFVADVKTNLHQTPGKLILSLAKTHFCAFFPMQGDNNYRVLGTMGKANRLEQDITFSDVEPDIQSALGKPIVIDQVNWFSTYRLHHRCVDKFRVGNCFLAGDSAHIHSPAGGQGMNTGLQDAYNLTWKLAMIFAGLASEKLLDTYHEERYPFAKWLMKFTDRAFGIVTTNNYIISRIRIYLGPYILRWFISRPNNGKKMFRTVSQIWYNYRSSSLSVQLTGKKLKFSAGDRFPYVHTPIEGKMLSCYHLFREAKFHLVVIGKTDSDEESNLIPERLKGFIKLVSLPITSAWMLLGVKDSLYILVRPDNYIGLLADSLDTNTLENYFRRLY